MWQPTCAPADIIGEISPFAINSNIGVTRLYFDASNSLHFVYYGTDVDLGAKTWSIGDWILCGVVINTTGDRYFGVWNANLSAEQSVAKGAPTHTSFYIGNDDGNVVGACGAIAEFKIYKDMMLNQQEVSLAYNESKGTMGI